MTQQLLAALRRAWATFLAFSAGQKVVALSAGLAIVIAGAYFATYRSAQPYAPLYTNLAASDASAIVDKLNSAGVPYKLAQAGSEILVPQDKVYSTRLTISAAGLPSSSQSGYALLDKEGVTTSEFKQQVDYQRAIEGELDKTIDSMAGMQSASVHLAIPQQNVFNDNTQKPTAAVLLSTAPGTQLTSAQVQSIVYLVSSSVPGLSSDNVTVTDSNGQLLAAPGSKIGGFSGTDSQAQATQQYDSVLAAQLQSLLTPVLGAGHAVVSVNAALDFSNTSTTSKSYLYSSSAPPLSETQTQEKYVGSGGTGGVLGAATPSAVPGGTGAGSYTKSSSTQDNALGTETVVSTNAPGDLKRLSIGVLLDGSVKGVQLTQVDALLRSAAGLQAARGDTLSIQAMPFNTSAADDAKAAAAKAAKAAAAKAAQQRLMSIVKQGVLVGLLAAVLVGVWLASRRRRNTVAPEPPDHFDEFFEPHPAPPQPDLTYAAELAHNQEAANRRRTLATLADEQPNEVASVLSGWINSRGDERGSGAWTPGMTHANRPTK